MKKLIRITLNPGVAEVEQLDDNSGYGACRVIHFPESYGQSLECDHQKAEAK
jgi:hypothetical protein